MDNQGAQAVGYATYKHVLDRLVGELQSTFGADLVSFVLFGSVARGTARPDSDIDTIVVVEKRDQEAWKKNGQAEEAVKRSPEWQALLARDMDPWLNLILLPRDQADQNRYLYIDITEDGIVLFDRDGFFASRMEKMRKRLRELGSIRHWLPDGGWYWDLKPDYRPGDRFSLEAG